MEIVSSSSNEKVKNLVALMKKSKLRLKEKRYVASGARMVAEVPMRDLCRLFVSESFYKKMNDKSAKTDRLYSEIKRRFNENSYVLTDELFKKISDTVTPQGVMAIVKMKSITADEFLQNCNISDKQNENKKIRKENIILILENISDPGNMGTIIRTAESAGIRGILLSSDCVDLYNPKVVRSTMGSIFRMNICISDDFISDVNKVKEEYRIYAAHLKGKKTYKDVRFPKKYGFIIGNEANGITDELVRISDELIKIPMYGNAESLNAAIAAAILMYA